MMFEDNENTLPNTTLSASPADTVNDSQLNSFDHVLLYDMPLLTDASLLDWIDQQEPATLPTFHEPVTNETVTSNENTASNVNNHQQQPRIIAKNLYGDLMYVLVSDDTICQRRVSDDFVNITRLLNSMKVPRGSRDHMLRKIKNRQVIRLGPVNLRGTWTSLDEARKLFAQALRQFSDLGFDTVMVECLKQLLSDDIVLYIDGSSLLKLCANPL